LIREIQKGSGTVPKHLETIKDKFCDLHRIYASDFQVLSQKADRSTCRKEYSRGGQTIHRGFYSPSRMDMVTGGMHRGKLLKGLPRSFKNLYEYHFDSQGRLIRVIKYGDIPNSPVETEFLIFESDCVRSFTFDFKYSLHYITECVYNDSKIIRYVTALCSTAIDNICIEINEEFSEYDDFGLLKVLHWQRYMPNSRLLTHGRYTFQRGEDQQILAYIAEDLSTPHSSVAPRLYRALDPRDR